MKSEIQEVAQRLELAERVVLRLNEALPRLSPDAEERRWLVSAEQRLGEQVTAARARLEQGIALPELKALRAERQMRLEAEWLGALREIYSELALAIGEGSPLVEALFPHRRFEKLERGGTALRTYRAQFETRRASSYVLRLATDPEYPFLAPLLARIEPSSEALTSLTAMEDVPEEELETLRRGVLDSGEALVRSLRQARCLAEAALIDQPDALAELQFDERPKKRTVSPPAEPPLPPTTGEGA
jgi:hypothetical protein